MTHRSIVSAACDVDQEAQMETSSPHSDLEKLRLQLLIPVTMMSCPTMPARQKRHILRKHCEMSVTPAGRRMECGFGPRSATCLSPPPLLLLPPEMPRSSAEHIGAETSRGYFWTRPVITKEVCALKFCSAGKKTQIRGYFTVPIL